jgi:hypothetical protein
MTNGGDSPNQAEYQVDEQLVRVLRERLLPDVQAAVRAGIAEELRVRLEQPMPLYYDRFISAELRRLDESIAHVGERIDALKEYVDQRFDEVDQRFAVVDQRFAEQQSSMDQRFAEQRTYMDQRFTTVDQRFAEQRAYMDQRFAEQRTYMDQRFAEQRAYMDQRFTTVDQRFAEQRAYMDQRFADFEHRLIALDQRLRDQRDEIMRHVDRSDLWTRALVGVVLAMTTAVLVKLFFP